MLRCLKYIWQVWWLSWLCFLLYHAEFEHEVFIWQVRVWWADRRIRFLIFHVEFEHEVFIWQVRVWRADLEDLFPKSCISPSILVLRFLVDRFIWARPRRRRRKPNRVTNFLVPFYLFAAHFGYYLRHCSLVYFTISVLVIAFVPWKCSVTNKEHILIKRLFQLVSERVACAFSEIRGFSDPF